ncbi:hypothetical protein A2U01_0101233, partial [Trifolium medium]|nr:hypothetical protein [Trifolium medium]
RLMKEEGIIITGDDIAKVSPLKERKDSSESEEDQPAPEGKVTADTAAATQRGRGLIKRKLRMLWKRKRK